MKRWWNRIWMRIRIWNPRYLPNPFYSPSLYYAWLGYNAGQGVIAGFERAVDFIEGMALGLSEGLALEDENE